MIGRSWVDFIMSGPLLVNDRNTGSFRGIIAATSGGLAARAMHRNVGAASAARRGDGIVAFHANVFARGAGDVHGAGARRTHGRRRGRGHRLGGGHVLGCRRCDAGNLMLVLRYGDRNGVVPNLNGGRDRRRIHVCHGRLRPVRSIQKPCPRDNGGQAKSGNEYAIVDASAHSAYGDYNLILLLF